MLVAAFNPPSAAKGPAVVGIDVSNVQSASWSAEALLTQQPTANAAAIPYTRDKRVRLVLTTIINSPKKYECLFRKADRPYAWNLAVRCLPDQLLHRALTLLSLP
jgi:hypothetical protein